MDIILFLAAVFILTFILGRVLETIRIPWIFSALIIGFGLSAYNPFEAITSSDSFLFLAQLGMYFLLFIIGFELDIKKVMESKTFILKTTLIVIISEAIFGTLLIHFLFNYDWLISALVASSFATVGEAVLLPILDEFNLTKKRLGQTILGVGVLDDLIEVITIILASVIIGKGSGYSHFNIWINLLVLLSLFGLAILLVQLRKYISNFKYKDIPSLFLFVIFFIFLFIGIGNFVESAALGALLAGVAIKNIIPTKMLKFIDSEIRTMAYGFFAPIFFIWVGLDTNISYIIKYPLFILAVLLTTKSTKIISSYIAGRKKLGKHNSIILGIALSVKFSTSIVIIKLLFEKGFIDEYLYSILVGATVAFKFIVPLLLAYLIVRWNIGKKKHHNKPA